MTTFVPSEAEIVRGCVASCTGKLDWQLCNDNFRKEIRSHVVRILVAALSDPKAAKPAPPSQQIDIEELLR